MSALSSGKSLSPSVAPREAKGKQLIPRSPVVQVPAGANLQDAINSIEYGVLMLEDGATFTIDTPIVMKPRVSIDCLGRAKIENKTRIGGGYGDIFLPGNFHPDFTSKFTFFNVGNVGLGSRLDVSIDGAAIGDQVFIRSKTGSSQGGFFIPHYAWISVISEIGNGYMEIRGKIDRAVAVEVAVLKNEVCRGGAKAFFWQDAYIRNIDIECPGKWISDSATLNTHWINLNVSSHSGIYGNTFQDTTWESCSFVVSETAGEQSHNSLRTIARNCTFRLTGDAIQGISIQEWAREIYYHGFRIEGSYAGSSPAIRIINAQKVVLTDGHIDIAGSPGASLLTMGSPDRASSDFEVKECKIINLKASFERQGRALFIFASDKSHDLVVRNASFSGVLTADAMRARGTSPALMSNIKVVGCTFPSGQIRQTGDPLQIDLTGSYVQG